MPPRRPRTIDFLSTTVPYQISHWCRNCTDFFYTDAISPPLPMAPVRCPRCGHEDGENYEDQVDRLAFHAHPFVYIPEINNNNFSPSVFLNSLQVKQMDPNAKCPICMDDFGRKMVVELPCGHCFDKDCIGLWIVRRANCPICRSNLNPRDDADDANGDDDLANREPVVIPDLSLRL